MRNEAQNLVKSSFFQRFLEQQELTINTSMTIKTALAKYEREKLPGYKTGDRIICLLNRLLALEVNTSVASITRQDIKALLEPYKRKNQSARYTQARATLSGFFKWAVQNDLAFANPVDGTETLPRNTREVVIDDDTLRAIWKASTKIRRGDFVQFCLLSGQRSGEVTGLRWDWVNLEKGIVTVPKQFYKTGKTHSYPLSPRALAIVKACKKYDCDGLPRKLPYVFGTGRARIQYKNHIKNSIEALTGPIGDWTFHDFRRTCRTRLEDYGVDRFEAERLLGHVVKGVEGTYNRSSFKFQKMRAVALWELYLIAKAIIPASAQEQRAAEAKLKEIEERMTSV